MVSDAVVDVIGAGKGGQGQRGSVPSGWHANASIMPADPPAIRVVDMGVGVLPFLPLTFVAMLLVARVSLCFG